MRNEHAARGDDPGGAVTIGGTGDRRHPIERTAEIVDITSPYGLTPRESLAEAERLWARGDWTPQEIATVLGYTAVELERVA